MSDADSSNRPRSLRDQQSELTRELIMRAFQELLRTDDPAAITYPQVAKAAGVSLRTVYRYFPTRSDLLQSAVAWLSEFTPDVQWDDPRTVSDLAGTVPEWARVFDEHTNVFRAIAESSEETDAPRRAAVAAAVAEVSGALTPEERLQAEAMLGYLRSGRAWLVLHDVFGLDGAGIMAALDWAATTLLADLRRRDRAAARETRKSSSTA